MKNGWPTKNLADVADSISTGPYGSMLHKSDYVPDGIPLVNPVNMVDARIVPSDKMMINEETRHRLGKYVLRTGDVVVARRGELGRCALVTENEDGWLCGTGSCFIRLSDQVDERFFVLLFSSSRFRELLEDSSVGTTMSNLNHGILKSLPVPVPPLPEQRRIVGILDEAFAGIATAKRNAEKNLQNARALFESHLNAVFVERGSEWNRETLATFLERGWIESHLDGNHGGDYPRKHEFISEGIPYISANCLDDERVDMTKAKYLSPERAALLRKGIAKDGDVLFAHNATVGPVAILRTDEEKVILGTSLTYYRCNPRHILPEYLAHYMRSFGFKVQYLQVMRQSTRNQVPITKQREFFHVIPPVDEQQGIIRQLDGLFDNARRLASIYHRKLASLDELKKSLLHEAFSGQL